MSDLPDVNVWVALSVPSHPDHERAASYWSVESAETIAFCRTTALGLVRVCAGQHTAGGSALSLDESWRRYQEWRNDVAVFLMEEPSDVEQRLDGWIGDGLVTRRTWTDAFLASFAITTGFRLVSFDRDFERFPGLDLLRL